MRETNNKDNVQAEGPEDYFRVRIIIIAVNATFNNISVISWRSVLLEETRENHLPMVPP